MKRKEALDVISDDWALSCNFSCQHSTSTISTNRYFFEERLSWKFAFHITRKYLAPSRDITRPEKYFRAVALPFVIIARLCLLQANVDDHPRLKGSTVELWNRCDIKCSQEDRSRALGFLLRNGIWRRSPFMNCTNLFNWSTRCTFKFFQQGGKEGRRKSPLKLFIGETVREISRVEIASTTCKK